MKRFIATTLVALAAILPVHAQYGNAPAPSPGNWHCISNSPIVSIDMQYQIAPDGQLYGAGSVVYTGTWQTYNVSGYGQWSASPPDQFSNEWLFRLQIAPQNHSVIAIYVRPTNNPGFMNNVFYNPQTGRTTETSCQKMG